VNRNIHIQFLWVGGGVLRTPLGLRLFDISYTKRIQARAKVELLRTFFCQVMLDRYDE
jgi:hypothetical protein